MGAFEVEALYIPNMIQKLYVRLKQFFQPGEGAYLMIS